MPVAPLPLLAARAIPTDPGYTVLLLLHVASALVGFGAAAVSGVQARAAARGPGGGRDDAVRRYFRPGVNVAARALYGVPIFGFALIAASRGSSSARDGFVMAGLVLWAAAVVVAEAVLWPAERRVQELVAGDWHHAAEAGILARPCRRVVVASGVLVAVFVVAVVLMVGRF
ncbi:MAG TPA: DUF2269 family protein [Acidimicrobiales bacterium]|nr:DUF2269 family protein [Acidimicrobiales bacterium]